MPCSEDATAGGTRSHVGEEIVVGIRCALYVPDVPPLP